MNVEQGKRARGRFRFSIRRLLILIGVVSIPLAFVGSQRARTAREEAALRQMGFTAAEIWEAQRVGVRRNDLVRYCYKILGTKLNALRLTGEQAADISPIVALASLEELSIGDFPRPLHHLEALSDLKSLRVLGIYNRQLDSLSPLARMTWLFGVFVRGTQVHDLSPLTQMTEMAWIDVSGTQVTDLSPLAGMNKLMLVNVSHTKVSDISPLRNSRDIDSLDISHTQVNDLTPIFGCVGLRALYIEGCTIEAKHLSEFRAAVRSCQIVQ